MDKTYSQNEIDEMSAIGLKIYCLLDVLKDYSDNNMDSNQPMGNVNMLANCISDEFIKIFNKL